MDGSQQIREELHSRAGIICQMLHLHTWDPLQSTCPKEECRFLCRHMYVYNWDPLCYDFQNGQLCKHVHYVHALRAIPKAQASTKESIGSGCSQLQSNDESDVDTVSYAESCISDLFHNVKMIQWVYNDL